MLDPGQLGEVRLEGVDVRAQRGDPVRVDGVPEVVELPAGQVRRGQIDPWHCARAYSGLHNHLVADGSTKMVFLGFGKFARADKIYALDPIESSERGSGRRTRVWVEGIAEPIVASRTERTILHDMGHDTATSSALVDDALDLAERLVEQTQAGRVDLGDLGRRARRLLEATTPAPEENKLF